MNIVNRTFRIFLKKKKQLNIKLKRLYCNLIGQVYLDKLAIIEPKAEIILDITTDFKYSIKIGEGSIIKDHARLCPRSGFIEIGTRCSINPFCILLGYGGITIGNNVRIAAHTSIISFNHIFDDPDKSIISQGNSMKGIRIEDDVWIGTGVRILDGVTIGEKSIIGAGAIVTKSVPPGSVAVGNPARILKSRL